MQPVVYLTFPKASQKGCFQSRDGDRQIQDQFGGSPDAGSMDFVLLMVG